MRGSRHQCFHGCCKHLGMSIDIGSGVVWRHQRHVVERRQQDAAVDGPQVHERVELVVDRSGRRRAIAGRRAEPIFCAAAELLHMPRQIVAIDRCLHTIGPRCCQRDHVGEVFVTKRRAQCGANRGNRQRVAGERSTDTADIDRTGRDHRPQLVGDLARSCRRQRPACRHRSSYR